MKSLKAEAQLHPTLCQYLGHFKQARYMREGHNTNAVMAPDGTRLDGTRVDFDKSNPLDTSQDRPAGSSPYGQYGNGSGGAFPGGEANQVYKIQPAKRELGSLTGASRMPGPDAGIGAPNMVDQIVGLPQRQENFYPTPLIGQPKRELWI